MPHVKEERPLDTLGLLAKEFQIIPPQNWNQNDFGFMDFTIVFNSFL